MECKVRKAPPFPIPPFSPCLNHWHPSHSPPCSLLPFDVIDFALDSDSLFGFRGSYVRRFFLSFVRDLAKTIQMQGADGFAGQPSKSLPAAGSPRAKMSEEWMVRGREEEEERSEKE